MPYKPNIVTPWDKVVGALRPSWDEYFINVAATISMRATCPRASVGAILVKDNRIIATGYNGSLPGKEHCIDVGCILNQEGHYCQRVVHAEDNVIFQAAKFGISTYGTTMYFWDSRGRAHPCDTCMPAVVSAGVWTIVNSELEVFNVTMYPYM